MVEDQSRTGGAENWGYITVLGVTKFRDYMIFWSREGIFLGELSTIWTCQEFFATHLTVES